MKNVILVGIGPTAHSALKSLTGSCCVNVVFRPAGEALDPVRSLAQQQGIPVCDETSQAAIRSAIQELRPDCVVTSSYNRIVGASLTGLCPFVNVHYSPLPRYRGRANVNWAIINGDPFAAVSIHVIDSQLDSGNILFQQKIEIGSRETVSALYGRLNEIQREHLGASVVRFLEGDPGLPQDPAGATYCCTRVPEDGQIRWDAGVAEIDRLIRALSPPFSAYSHVGGRRLFILRAEPLAGCIQFDGRIPGRVVEVNRSQGTVDVLTGDGILRLYEIQAENSPVLPAAELIRSTKDTLGLSNEQLLGRIGTLEVQIAALREELARHTRATPVESAL